MKDNTKQQEVMLLTNTTFSKKKWCENNAAGYGNLSAAEHLEEACWNRLLYDLFPEMMERSAEGKRLFVWHVRNRGSLLQIELSAFPVHLVKKDSINPDFFLAEKGKCN